MFIRIFIIKVIITLEHVWYIWHPTLKRALRDLWACNIVLFFYGGCARLGRIQRKHGTSQMGSCITSGSNTRPIRSSMPL
jgi:hypothetical protein